MTKLSAGRKAYAKYLDAKCKPTPGGRYKDTALSQMQIAIRDALLSDDPIPIEMQRHVAFAFMDVCAGFKSELFTPQFAGNAKPIREAMIKDAIRYIRWAKEGKIQDNGPTQTIAEWYGVGIRQVQRWVKQWEGMPTPPIYDCGQADAEGELRQKAEMKAARLVRSSAEASGAIYLRY